jgi:hypothetical protein
MDQHTQAFEEPEQYGAHDTDRLQRISDRAFAHFEARGGEHGHDIEDWLAAEQEETAEATARRSADDAEEGLRGDGQVGGPNGQVRQEGIRKGREGDARASSRNAQERPVR